MISPSSPSQHLDPETLAAFAEGKLDAAARDEVIAHLIIAKSA
jgi:anti-sigma factor ChrR (cupin superfamily)